MQDIRERLKQSIKDLYGLDFEPEITSSPDNIDADYSSNAPLKLAKELHQPPMKIAEALNESLNASISNPGFLNFNLDDKFLKNKIDNLSSDFDQEILIDKYKNKTIICEFSDPNPFKVLHVGHLYTSIVGDAISRLFEYAGANVIRANFGGDVGLHVAKTMYILKEKNIDELTIGDIANCYIEGTAAYEENEEAKKSITELNKEIYRINSEKSHDGHLAELYWKGRELSYDYFRNFYDSINVKFDKYYPESTVAELGLKTVKEQLENGVYEMSNGAVIFNGEKHGLHTRVFINKEGVPTYESKDVGLIFTKWQDYHFDKSIIITGSEQKDYMAVVLKSIEQYAPELTKRTVHLTHGLVKLPGGVKMSSRKGNFLKAVDVLNLVKDELKNAYNSEDDTVSLAATKYAFLKYKMGGHIIFDPKESVKMTGNSGPYLLYSAVRAKKILGKDIENIQQAKPSTDSEPSNDKQNTSQTYTLMPNERNLVKKVLEYKSVLEEAITELAPHKVANYLYELAQTFSRFYETCPVRGSDQEQARLKLTKIYLLTMTHGLNLLGIKIPEEM